MLNYCFGDSEKKEVKHEREVYKVALFGFGGRYPCAMEILQLIFGRRG